MIRLAAVMEGVERLGGRGRGLELRHGTTVGTNAMLERKGARVAFVTTAGFEDTIAIGRQTRPLLYAWTQPAAAVLGGGRSAVWGSGEGER